MEQKKFEKILNGLYPNLTITDYELWERYAVDDEGNFINPIAPAIIVEVRGEIESVGVSVGDDISRMTGLEVVVNKI